MKAAWTAWQTLLGAGWRYLLVGALLFVVTFALSMLVIGLLLVHLPESYFLGGHQRGLWGDHHPAVRWTLIAAKNLLGAGLVLLGLVLSLPGIPGQGVLTILIGIILLDFPGKHRLERWLVSRPPVRRRIDGLRRRFGRPPLLLTPPSRRDENEN